MGGRIRSLWWVVAGSSVLLGAAGLTGIQVLIRSEVRATGARAMLDYPGDRVHALMRVVDCQGCTLPRRNRAVWALGEMGDPVALPVLRKYHTRERCDHALNLCQYELGKAIKKIEGSWNLDASFHYKGTDPTGP